MRSRRDVIALIVLFVSMFTLAVLVRTRGDLGASEDPRRSTFGTGPAGARALRLLADELDMNSELRLRAFTVAPAESVRLVVILAPHESLTPREISRLLSWVRDGGTLLYAMGGARLLADSLQLRRQFIPPERQTGVARARWEGVVATPTDDPLARGAGEVGRFRFGFVERSVSLLSDAKRVVATARGTPVIVAYPHGAGHIVAFSDAAALSNGALRSGGAALVFARVARQALADAPGAGVIEFDEYHQGYRGDGGPWAALRAFLRTAPGYTTLQAAVAGLIVLLLAGHRFGAPLSIAPPRRRSPIEHVDALAGAYRRAGARSTARRLLLEGMQRRLGRRPVRDGGPPPGTDRTPAGQKLIEEWERGAHGNLVGFAHAVDEVVQEVRR